jgi:hypothetical protein
MDVPGVQERLALVASVDQVGGMLQVQEDPAHVLDV